MAKGTTKSFTASIDKWVADTEAASLDTFKDSVKAIAKDARDAQPHETGNLARSIVLSKDPRIPLGANDEVFPDPAANDAAVLADLKLGDHVYLGSLAAYANRIEFGHTTSTGKHVAGRFGMLTAMNGWRGVVQRVAKRAFRG